jgi:1-acyl-sn-glycerol-3-phosphate acyltransferase
VRRFVYFVTAGAIRFIMFLFCRWQIRGRENVPRRGGVILAPNHTSYLDPPVAAVAIHRQVFFMAKAELFEVPLLSSIIRVLGAFPVRLGVADRAALRRAEQLLRAGYPVMVFPEGRRSLDGRLLPAEPGIAMLALRTGAPVMPVAVDGTDRALPRGSFIMRPAKVRIRIGPPLTFDDLRRDGPLTREAVEEAARRITAALAEMLPVWRGSALPPPRSG